MDRDGDHTTDNVRSAPLFSEVLDRRLTRRDVLKAGVTVAAGMAVGSLVGPHRAVAGGAGGQHPCRGGSTGLGFKALEKFDLNKICVPDGYEAVPLIKWGDPLRPGLEPFDINSQTAEGQRERFGFSNDFIGFFPLLGHGRGERALLWVNHENSMGRFMFRGWDPEKPTEEHVHIAQASLGGTVVEIYRDANGNWHYNPTSPYNRRVTATTPIGLTGPAAGCPWLRTKADPTGRLVLGTFSNCAGGVTPWGTVLSAEENFDMYFNMGEYIDERPNERVARTYKQYYNTRWTTDIDRPAWHKCDARFDVFNEPNEPFRFGWIVEIDPYDPMFMPRKRTALGRFKHEGAATTLAADGRAVVYSGEDEDDKYVYKFVSRRPVDVYDRSANWDVLDEGTLYAARFFDDGTGVWLPLRFGVGALCPPMFVSQADVLVRAREAACEVQATPMDRAEDVDVSPLDGRVYMSLTKNTAQDKNEGSRPNPRRPNPLGHVIELIEDGDDAAATSFTWEIFLLCGKPENLVTDPRSVDSTKAEAQNTSYFAGYSAVACLSPIANPDNLTFDRAGNLWIATDGQEDALCGLPDALHAVPTSGGERGRVQQFLSAVKGAEVTGPCFAPANDALFVSIQHPGKDKKNTLDEAGNWPDEGRPPRPSVVVVTKADGGLIGT